MTRRQILAFGIAIVAAASPLSAHHSWPVDQNKLVTVKGTVTEIVWGNPHPMFSLDVMANGRIEKWSVGGPAVNRMEANGWTRTTLKVGDVITGTGYQFSDGQKTIRLEHVVLPDGKKLRVYAR